MDNSEAMGIPVLPGMGGQTPFPPMDYIQAGAPEITGMSGPVYPEIYYKIQPQVMMMCDRLDAFGTDLTMETMYQASDSIYDDTVKLYPDVVEYAGANMPDPAMPDAVETMSQFRRPGFDRRRGFRRRGPVRDFIDLLLLNELRRRRRWFF